MVIRAITSIMMKVTVAPTNDIVSTHNDSDGTLFVLIITSCGPRNEASEIACRLSSPSNPSKSSSARVGK